MAFVNEKIDGKWRTVDHERNAVLTEVSGPNIEGVYHCELMLDGRLIKFSGTLKDKVFGSPPLGEERQYDMTWYIFQIIMQDDLQPQKKFILQIIENALEAWGWNYRPDKAHSVSVEFNPIVL